MKTHNNLNKKLNSLIKLVCIYIAEVTPATETSLKDPNKGKGNKPVFTKPLQHEIAEDGTSVRLDCKISADPEAEVKW